MAISKSSAFPSMKAIPVLSDRQRAQFWAQVDRQDPSGCWLWLGLKNAKGYSRWSRYVGHRVAWTLTHGPIPDGFTIDHLCRVRACVNPAHFEIVTDAENKRRGRVARGPVPPRNRKGIKHRNDWYYKRRSLGLCIDCDDSAEKSRCNRCSAIHNERNKGRLR